MEQIPLTVWAALAKEGAMTLIAAFLIARFSAVVDKIGALNDTVQSLVTEIKTMRESQNLRDTLRGRRGTNGE